MAPSASKSTPFFPHQLLLAVKLLQFLALYNTLHLSTKMVDTHCLAYLPFSQNFQTTLSNFICPNQSKITLPGGAHCYPHLHFLDHSYLSLVWTPTFGLTLPLPGELGLLLANHGLLGNLIHPGGMVIATSDGQRVLPLNWLSIGCWPTTITMLMSFSTVTTPVSLVLSGRAGLVTSQEMTPFLTYWSLSVSMSLNNLSLSQIFVPSEENHADSFSHGFPGPLSNCIPDVICLPCPLHLFLHHIYP